MNQSTLYFVAAAVFFMVGIVYFLYADASLGATFTALGAVFITIGSSDRKGPQAVAAPLELSEAQQREVQALIDAGRKAEAVKRVREGTGAELMEAKRYVDQLKSSRMT